MLVLQLEEAQEAAACAGETAVQADDAAERSRQYAEAAQKAIDERAEIAGARYSWICNLDNRLLDSLDDAGDNILQLYNLQVIFKSLLWTQ